MNSAPPCVPWKGYLENGFFLSDGRIDRDLVWPDKLLPLVRSLKESGSKVKLAPTQMRRWFHAFRRIGYMLERDPSRWGEAEKELALVRSRSDYAFSTEKIPPEFLAVVHGCIDAVMRAGPDDSAKTHAFLKGLLVHFEAFVGYATGPLKGNERR